MNNYSRISCFVGLAGALFSVVAPQARASDASGDSAAAGQIEEIVVTAQRREERLQDVPLSVVALSASDLENAGLQGALDLPNVVSGLQFQNNVGSIQPFLRGIGNLVDNAGNDPSIATYVDGVYYARINPAMLLFNDIERVEVLKGPQGTLFGRNADGGLINIVTQDPSMEPTGDLKVGYGNYNTFSGSAYYSMGFGANVAGNIAAAFTNQGEGWGHSRDGSQFNYENDTAVRSKWLFTITDDTKFKLVLNFDNEVSTEGLSGNVLTGYEQGSPYGPEVFPQQVGFYNSPFPAGQDGLLRSEDYGVNGVLTHNFSFATLTNSTAYNSQRQPACEDTANAYDVCYNQSNDSVTNDLQLASKSGGIIDWIGGFYYLRQVGAFDPLSIDFYGPLSSALGGPNSEIQYSARVRDVSYAGYGQTTYHVAPATDLILGARYSWERVNETGNTNYVVGGVTSAQPYISQYTDFIKWTYKAGVDYHFTRDIMGYVSVSTGFKAGAYNVEPVVAGPAVQPESLTAYEIGVKSELFENRLRLNAAVFYYNVKDLQFEQVVQDIGVLKNAASAEDKGIDLDGQVYITKDLSAHFGATLLDAKYTSFPNAPYYLPNPNPPYGLGPVFGGNATGNYLSYAPTLSYNVGIDYRLDTGVGQWLYSANYAYQSHYYFDPQNVGEQPAHGLLNMTLALTPKNFDHWQTHLWGRNLTNRQYYTQGLAISGAFGFASAPAAPRTYGADIEYHF